MDRTMNGHRIAQLLGWTLLLSAALSLPASVLAKVPNQAALVIQLSDGRLETRCVPLDGQKMNGADLLTRSGLDVIVDAASGMGLIVCQIEGDGCDFPAEPCFCQCMGGGECTYWNYFYREAGADQWTYSALGAAMHQVQPGSVEGWVWGDGHTPPATDLTFASICTPPTATPTPTTPPPTSLPTDPPPAATTSPSATPPPASLPTATTAPPTPAPMPTPTPAPAPDPGQDLSGYWPFGLIVIGFALISAFVWFRRR